MPNHVKILIVDDDALLRFTFSQIFLSLGYDVRSACDGFNALEEIRLSVPDVLLSDLNMAGMSGFELLSIIRRRFPSIHVIAMSGAFSGDGLEPHIPADDFYPKGTSLPGLLKLMESCGDAERAALRGRGENGIPVWLPKNVYSCNVPEFVTVICHECLRPFAQSVDGSGNGPYEANCVHCTSKVSYAVVPMNATHVMAP